jgi:glyoxylase-like metal-dependent hydrolase (beta-lactamase superfamily II)
MPEPVERWSFLTSRVLAPNAGPMTLDGTNTFVIRHPDSTRVVVVDPGPTDAGHLERLLAAGEIELILLTHWHEDHTEAARRLAMTAGAPVRAADPQLCVDAPPLRDGEVIHAAGAEIRVLATPGHTADSVCLHLPGDGDEQGMPRASMLTGDTILGRGTTVIAQPDGRLRDYLRTLERLAALSGSGAGRLVVLPAHGPKLDDLGAIASSYLAHRKERLTQVSAAVDSIRRSSPSAVVTVGGVTDLVYADSPPDVRFAAEASVAAQLAYLADPKG